MYWHLARNKFKPFYLLAMALWNCDRIGFKKNGLSETTKTTGKELIVGKSSWFSVVSFLKLKATRAWFRNKTVLDPCWMCCGLRHRSVPLLCRPRVNTVFRTILGLTGHIKWRTELFIFFNQLWTFSEDFFFRERNFFPGVMWLLFGYSFVSLINSFFHNHV